MQRIDRLLKFSQDDTARFRLQVINYHKKHGTALTIEAYGVSKPTIYRWRGELEKNGGRISALIPKSRSPKKKRQMVVDPRIVDWIKDERAVHLVGKTKLKPLLDEYCKVIGIKPPSESLIGKIIKVKGISAKRNGRTYHNPNSKYAERKPNYKSRIKKCPSPDDYGHLGIDTITEFNLGIKRYIFNAVDIKLKFEFSYPYKSLNSKNGRDFLEKLEQVYPIKDGIKDVQTDNGLEFLGEFDCHLKEKNIGHNFIYPRCPKINGHIERANRSLKDEFVNQNIGLLFTDLDLFKDKLMKHLIWYNTKRVHHSLGNLSPIDYLLKNNPESHMYATYTSS